MNGSRAGGWLPLAAGAPVFVALAIANSAGYRYGVSDLAFYLPAAFRHVDPRLFARDAALLDVQARLTFSDEVLGAALRGGQLAGLGEGTTVYVLHVAALLLLYFAAIQLGRAVFRSRWAIAALLAALTLRHAVGRTGVNTLEGYFHPRVLAFALGVAAFAVFLRRGIWPALVLALLAVVFHTTTAFWFLVCLGVAGLASERRQRIPLLAMGIVAAAMLAYAVFAGPLAGRLHAMDAAWLAVIAEKDYLFPDRWPLDAWLIVLVYVAVCAYAARARSAAGLLQPRERALLAGAAALVAIFLVMLPPLFARSALAVQIQPSRVFWILDLLAVVGVIWVAERAAARHGARVLIGLAAALVIFSTARGVYLLAVRFPDRSIVRTATPDSPWEDAMRFVRTTDVRSHWLAHPDHTYLYGSGVRVSGRRDVFIERSKDPALAMYDRDVAMRVAERLAEVGDFDALTADRVRALAGRYDLDYLITENPLRLPLAYENAQFRVYSLRSP